MNPSNGQSSLSYGSAAWFDNKLKTQGSGDPAAYFASDASGYHRYRYACLLARLRAAAPQPLRGAILDVGCGTGEFLALACKEHAFDRAVGVDFVELAVSIARQKHPELEFSSMVLPELSFQDQSFDVVLAVEVLYYLDDAGRAEALTQIRRVLKPDGFLLFASVLGQRYFTLESARRYLNSRFNVERIWCDHNRLYHLLTAPLTSVNKLRYRLISGTAPTGVRSSQIYARCRPLLELGVVRALLGLACVSSRPLLRSEGLPRFCSAVARRIMPAACCSNITILARKA